MTRRLGRFAAVLVAACLIAAGCSDDDERTTTGGRPGGSSGVSGGGECELDGPVKLAFTWEVQGESDVALDDYENGARLAIDEINASGGVCGQQIEVERIPTPTLDPQGGVAAFLKAVDTKPAAILGMPSQIIQDAALSQIERSRIPTITLSPNDRAIFGTDNGSEYLWLGPAPSKPLAEEAARYAVEDLGLESLGFMGTNESFGNDALDAIEPVLKELGVELRETRQHAPSAGDLTQEVLAMKGVDGVLDFGYPNDIALALKQLEQNGITVPVIDGASADIVALYQLASAAQLERLHASVDCSANATERPEMKAFVDAYQEKYNSLPFAYGIVAYDLVKFVAKAIENAGTDDPEAVNDAIATTELTGGACHPTYKADGAHTLAHSGIVVKFRGDGSAETVKEFTIPDLEEGGQR